MSLKDKDRPEWLNKKIDIKKRGKLSLMLDRLELRTICKEAFCPNISECFSKGVATFLILGNICTRGCAFCGVGKGKPMRVDPNEPQRVKEAVSRLALKHVVITSVTRDDLEDCGASHFAAVISAVRRMGGEITVEALIPDFKDDREALTRVLSAGPRILAHNIETVPSLYSVVRQGADYPRSVSILKDAKTISPMVITKSGIMLGLGEGRGEVLEAIRTLREASCDLLSIGQYLSPGPGHAEVKEYISPETFGYYKEKALGMGFTHVESGPYVRSSYLADRYIVPY